MFESSLDMLQDVNIHIFFLKNDEQEVCKFCRSCEERRATSDGICTHSISKLYIYTDDYNTYLIVNKAWL